MKNGKIRIVIIANSGLYNILIACLLKAYLLVLV